MVRAPAGTLQEAQPSTVTVFPSSCSMASRIVFMGVRWT